MFYRIAIVQSKRDWKVFYEVFYSPEEDVWACTCPGSVHHGHCYHLDRVLERLKRFPRGVMSLVDTNRYITLLSPDIEAYLREQRPS